MTNSNTPKRDEIQTFIIGLGPRRYIIVNTDEQLRVCPVDGDTIAELKPTDRVIYQGKEEVVHQIQAY